MSISLVTKRARALQDGAVLGDKERVLSDNKVTGVSLNVPIWGTCKPTKVCAETCYAARNVPIALPNSLKKQLRIYNSIKSDPHGVGGRIVAEMIRHMRKGAKFLRWNGVGDLFEESIVCLQGVAEDACEACGRCWDGTAQGMAVVAVKASVETNWREVEPASNKQVGLF